jgi:hypothetical protein
MDVFSNMGQDGNHFPAELISSRRQYMKKAKWLVAVTLMLLSGMAFAQLNSDSRVVAQVPFKFMIANKTIPAGQCEVRVATMDRKTLQISNAGSGVSLFSPSYQTESKQGAAQYALVFKQYGDRYFLSGIKLQGSKIAYRLPESKLEAELRAENVPSTEETLLASLK